MKLLTCSGQRLADAFQRFWREYPPRRPNPKALAEHEFAKAAKDGFEPEQLVRAAAAYAAECRRLKAEAAYIPHARTFLAQRRFLDYLDGGEAPPESAVETMRELQGDPRLKALACEMGQVEYDTWIAPLALEARGRQVAIVAPSAMHRDWVRNRYGDLLRRILGTGLAYEARRERS